MPGHTRATIHEIAGDRKCKNPPLPQGTGLVLAAEVFILCGEDKHGIYHQEQCKESDAYSHRKIMECKARAARCPDIDMETASAAAAASSWCHSLWRGILRVDDERFPR